MKKAETVLCSDSSSREGCLNCAILQYQQGRNIEHTSTAALMLAREGELKCMIEMVFADKVMANIVPTKTGKTYLKLELIKGEQLSSEKQATFKLLNDMIIDTKIIYKFSVAENNFNKITWDEYDYNGQSFIYPNDFYYKNPNMSSLYVLYHFLYEQTLKYQKYSNLNTIVKSMKELYYGDHNLTLD